MRCQRCRKSETRVTETRAEATYIRRRRTCIDQHCAFRFTTYERQTFTSYTCLTSTGEREPFDPARLALSIDRALGAKTFDAPLGDVVREVEARLFADRAEAASVEIAQTCITVLRAVDEAACLLYASVHGPLAGLPLFAVSHGTATEAM